MARGGQERGKVLDRGRIEGARAHGREPEQHAARIRKPVSAQ